MNEPAKSPQQRLTEAAEHLRLALELLDSADAPAHIGAHVDLAIHQLEEELGPDLDGDLNSAKPSESAKNLH